LLKHAQKNKTLNKHLTSKFQFSPNFTLDSVADSNYRGKCDVGGFLIFENGLYVFVQGASQARKLANLRAICILTMQYPMFFVILRPSSIPHKCLKWCVLCLCDSYQVCIAVCSCGDSIWPCNKSYE
jgi:hypothetical protein